MSVSAASPGRTQPIVPPYQTYADVTEQLAGIPLRFPHRRIWLIALGLSSALLGLLFVSATVLFSTGVGIWGLHIPVNRAFAISQMRDQPDAPMRKAQRNARKLFG